MTHPYPEPGIFVTEDTPHVVQAYALGIYAYVYGHPALHTIDSEEAESQAMLAGYQADAQHAGWVVEHSVAQVTPRFVLGNFGFGCPQMGYFGRDHLHPAIFQQALLGYYSRKGSLGAAPFHSADLIYFLYVLPVAWRELQHERSPSQATVYNDAEYITARITRLHDFGNWPAPKTGPIHHILDNVESRMDEVMAFYGVGDLPEAWRFDDDIIEERYGRTSS